MSEHKTTLNGEMTLIFVVAPPMRGKAFVCVSGSIDFTEYLLDLSADVEMSFSPYITNKTTHFVTTSQEVDKNTSKVISAKRNHVSIVSESYLRDCVNSGSVLEAGPYLLVKEEEEEEDENPVMEQISTITSNNKEKKRNLNPERRREIKVFVSSTFRDMKDERNLLLNKVYPYLHNICQQRNVSFSFVDFQWGITEQESHSAKTMGLCLDAIDGCRPYFIGILGERYGWAQNAGFPTDDLLAQSFMNASSSYPWVNQFKDRSIVEIEMLYGAIQPELSTSYNATSEDDKTNPRSFFLFRDPLSITKRFELGDPERKNFEEVSEDGHRKLRELKNTIRDSKVPLIDGYVIEIFCDEVLTFLLAAIEEDFPADEAEAKQKTVNKSTPSVFYRVDSVMKALDEYVNAVGDSVPFTLAGGEGMGKTVSLHYWMKERSDKKINEEIFISCPVGDTQTNFPLVLFKLLAGSFPLSAIEYPSSYKEDAIRIFFIQVFDAIHFQLEKQKKKLILALPGVHHLTSFSWFPILEQPHIKVIYTSYTNTNHNGIAMKKWNSKEKEIFIQKYLQSFSKKMETRHIQLITKNNATGNPLFLRILLDQLILTGSFDNMTLSLGTYLGSSDVSYLFECILSDWNKVFHEQEAQMICVLGVLCFSYAGWTEQELKEVSSFPDKHWASFFYTLKVFTRTTKQGLTFYHSGLKKAVQNKFFKFNAKEAILCRMIKYMESKNIFRTVFELPFLLQKLPDGKARLGQFLAERDQFPVIHSSLDIEEIYSLWKHAGNALQLDSSVLSNEECTDFAFEQFLVATEGIIKTEGTVSLLHSCKNSLRGHKKYWFALYLERNGNYDEARLHMEAILSSDRYTIEYYTLIGLILKKQGFYDLAVDKYEECLNITNIMEKEKSSYANIKLALGDIERKRGKFNDALTHYDMALNLLTPLLGEFHLRIMEIKRAIGLVYKRLANYGKAKAEYAKALHILDMKEMQESREYGFILGELADVYRKNREYLTARQFYDSSLYLVKKTCGEKHPEVAQVLNSIGILLKKQGKYSHALPLFRQSLEIIQTTFGNEHYKYATCLNNMGDVQRKTGNFADAILSYREALHVFASTLGKEHSEYAEVCNNMGLVFKKQGDYKNAYLSYEDALRITFQEFGAGHVKVGIYLSNLADVFRKEKKFGKALQVYQQSFDIICICLGIQDIEIADIRQNRALVYMEQNRFSLAHEELASASRVISKSLGDRHPKMGYCIHKQGMLASFQGEWEKAATLLETSLSMLYESLDRYHPEVADVLITLGEVQLNQNSAKAIKTFQSALEIVFFCFGDSHYKYKSISKLLKEAGGEIPVFAFPKSATKDNKQKDWRQALNELILDNKPSGIPLDEQNSAKQKMMRNNNLMLVALSSGLF